MAELYDQSPPERPLGDQPMPEQSNAFRKTEEISEAKQKTAIGPRPWTTPALLGLGILLLIGGIVLGMRNQNPRIVDLPEYSPIYISPASSSLPPEESPVSSPKTANGSPIADLAARPVIQASPVALAPAGRQLSSPKVRGSATVEGPTKPIIGPVVRPVPSTPATIQIINSNLPPYQPTEVLSEFSPQFVSPSPSPTQTVSLSLPGKQYTIAIRSGITVLEVIQIASQQGLSYRIQEFSGLGSKVVELNGQAEGNSKFWTYTINGIFATRGISSQTVTVNDQIVWTLS